MGSTRWTPAKPRLYGFPYSGEFSLFCCSWVFSRPSWQSKLHFDSDPPTSNAAEAHDVKEEPAYLSLGLDGLIIITTS